MKLILTTAVDHLGAPGDIVGGKAASDVYKRQQQDRIIRDAEHAREVKEALEALTDVTVAVKSAENGKLFGSVTAADIVTAIEKADGPKIDRHAVELTKGQIKAVGTYDIAVALSDKVTATVNVTVTAE